MITPQKLRRIRNQVSIDRVIDKLGIPVKRLGGLRRFLCPLCGEFHTATNPRTNLARCFRCQRNFNPIDLVMTVEGLDFLDAVNHLAPLLD